MLDFLQNYRSLFTMMILLTSPVILWSQTGINTTSPRKTLEIGGDMIIENSLSIGKIAPLQDGESSTFLIQEGDNSIMTLDVSNPTSEALGYIQSYVIDHPFQDFVRDFDTGVSATNYVMIAISADYDEELTLSNTNSQSDNYSLPYTFTFISGGTWHIVANYPVARNGDTTAEGTWTINTLIFSKDLSKNLGIVNIPMSNSSTGSAVSPILD